MNTALRTDILNEVKKVNHFNVIIDNVHFIYDISESGVIPRNTWKTDLHFHLLYEIHFLLSGKAEVRTDSGKYILFENDVLIIKPGVLHQTSMLTETVLHSCISFDIICSSFSGFGLYRTFVSDKTGACLLRGTDLFDKYIAASGFLMNHDIFGYSRIQAYLQLLTADFLEKIMRPCTESCDPNHENNPDYGSADYRRQLLDNIISEYYMEDWTIEKIAGYMQLSPKQASRIITKLTGLSFADNLLRQRMSIAKKMLESDTAVSNVAEMTGYKSYNGFLKAFKKYHGILPSSSKTS